MYNRYIRGDDGRYERVPVDPPPPPPGEPHGNPPPPPPGGTGWSAPPPPPPNRGFLSGILDKLNLRAMDSGDLLLLFLLFLLFREGEDEELLLALGLLLIL